MRNDAKFAQTLPLSGLTKSCFVAMQVEVREESKPMVSVRNPTKLSRRRTNTSMVWIFNGKNEGVVKVVGLGYQDHYRQGSGDGRSQFSDFSDVDVLQMPNGQV